MQNCLGFPSRTCKQALQHIIPLIPELSEDPEKTSASITPHLLIDSPCQAGSGMRTNGASCVRGQGGRDPGNGKTPQAKLTSTSKTQILNNRVELASADSVTCDLKDVKSQRLHGGTAPEDEGIHAHKVQSYFGRPLLTEHVVNDQGRCPCCDDILSLKQTTHNSSEEVLTHHDSTDAKLGLDIVDSNQIGGKLSGTSLLAPRMQKLGDLNHGGQDVSAVMTMQGLQGNVLAQTESEVDALRIEHDTSVPWPIDLPPERKSTGGIRSFLSRRSAQPRSTAKAVSSTARRISAEASPCSKSQAYDTSVPLTGPFLESKEPLDAPKVHGSSPRVSSEDTCFDIEDSPWQTYARTPSMRACSTAVQVKLINKSTATSKKVSGVRVRSNLGIKQSRNASKTSK